MNNNEFEDLEKIFDKDIPLPESLSKENMVNMLKEKQAEPKRKVKIFPKILSVAAAAVIVIVGTLGVKTLNNKIDAEITHNNNEQQIETNTMTNARSDNESMTPNTQSNVSSDLSKFPSDAELKAYFTNLHSVQVKTTVAPGAPGAAEAKEQFDSASSDLTAMATQSVFNQTNRQVENVDESNIIKNDGRYLYIISNTATLNIVDTQTMKKIYSKNFGSKDDDIQIDIEQMHLIGNRLVLIGSKYDLNRFHNTATGVGCCGVPDYITDTMLILFDISDKSNVKEIKRITQSGTRISTRVIGNVLYTATGYVADVTDKDTIDETAVPSINGEKFTHNDIYRDAARNNVNQYIVLSAWDTANENTAIGKVSVLGEGYEVYCTSSKMYITGNEIDPSDSQMMLSRTKIYSFSLNQTNIDYDSCSVVPGSIDDQYSIDEHNGYLRIATTVYNYKNGIYQSNVYVLDSKLNIVGELEDIAKNEQIKSARFIGDMAYIVTYRNTDPLFAVDLSDPASPKITGKIKLPGFSTYLHPVSDSLIVGFGYSGNEETADMISFKISLFDVSDSNNPKEVDSRVINDAGSDINNDPKALMFYPEKNLIGIPLYYYHGNNDRFNPYDTTHHFKTLKIENGQFIDGIDVIHTIGHNDYTSLFRGCYIGDKLYTITDLSVMEHNITSGQELRTVVFGR
ncbi:MAG: beta-propeller domain-containing protein [Faecalibacterium sp.]|nr:beta-propeller domain-containing protein [Ruminococcus sp.]MCM1392186.1 beta-propeller domain-containing protein [Ruminococcus sp.]MCM1485404.1 beta-propeller domain-containing protein [Faecalibacterium sp.]